MMQQVYRHSTKIVSQNKLFFGRAIIVLEGMPCALLSPPLAKGHVIGGIPEVGASVDN